MAPLVPSAQGPCRHLTQHSKSCLNAAEEVTLLPLVKYTLGEPKMSRKVEMAPFQSRRQKQAQGGSDIPPDLPRQIGSCSSLAASCCFAKRADSPTAREPLSTSSKVVKWQNLTLKMCVWWECDRYLVTWPQSGLPAREENEKNWKLGRKTRPDSGWRDNHKRGFLIRCERPKRGEPLTKFQ